jgi:hypothetical protein
MPTTKPLSLRLDRETLSRLDALSERSGERRSELIRRYAEEGLRMDEHPRIVFRPGPAGRRAAVAGGPDVWTVIAVMRDLGVSGERAVARTAEHLELDLGLVRAAVGYFAEYPEEVDLLIRRNEQEAERFRAAALRERAALE